MKRHARTQARRLRVAIVGTRGYPSYYGGFETAVRHLAPYLATSGWEVTVYGRGRKDDIAHEADGRVKVRNTRGLDSKSLSTLTYGLTATLAAARTRPDVVLVMNVANGYWLPILRAMGIPTLLNVDGIEWERSKWGTIAKAVFRAGAWFSAKFANELIVDAVAIGEIWAKRFGRQGIYIPYGSDDTPDRGVPLQLVSGGFVLYVARFVPENSFDEFIEAAESLSANWPVVIVGSSGYGGELDGRVQALADRNENVIWMGHLADDRTLHGLWRHCGVYFHGHSVGGTNPALVQAMRLGAAVVARSSVFNAEVLGDAGVLVAPQPARIVDEVARLMRDARGRERLAARATQRAADRYDWDDICKRYEASLRGLAGSNA